MDRLTEFVDSVRSRIGGPAWYREPILEELEGHLRESMSELMRGGLPEDEAVAVAIERFGTSNEVAERFALECPPRAGLARRVYQAIMEAGMLSKIVVGIALLTMLGAAINTYFALAQPDDPAWVAVKVFVGLFVVVVGAFTIVARNTENPARAAVLMVCGLVVTALGSAGFLFALVMARTTGDFEGPIVLIQMLLATQGVLTAWMVWRRIAKLRAVGSR